MRRIVVVVLALAVTLAVAACGSKQVSTVLAPQVSHDEATARTILSKCGVSTTTVTLPEITKFRSAAGRKAITACVVPAGHAKAFQACALKAVTSHIGLTFFTPANGAKILASLTKCAVVNR